MTTGESPKRSQSGEVLRNYIDLWLVSERANESSNELMDLWTAEMGNRLAERLGDRATPGNYVAQSELLIHGLQLKAFELIDQPGADDAWQLTLLQAHNHSVATLREQLLGFARGAFGPTFGADAEHMWASVLGMNQDDPANLAAFN